jgi:riboflavin kinase/FMN adenylyltransferase
LSLEIIYGLEHIDNITEDLVVSLGTFDGLHVGHQAILKSLMNSAEKTGLNPMAVTFEPHPRVLVTPDSPPPLLTVWEEKARLFADYMNGRLLVLRFNKELMSMSAEEFASDILVGKLNLKKLIVGYDHAFGKNRSGTINDLMSLSRKYNFELEVVNPVIIEGRPVSSTRIRNLIADRKYSQALDMLGHPYPIYGPVVKGISLGKDLGFPTANIEVHERKLLPVEGVYSCRVEHKGQMYHGMMFIGTNHFNPDRKKSVEVNIFDFDRDIYGQDIICYPRIFIRENMRFENKDDLMKQIANDKENILKLINKGDHS